MAPGFLAATGRRTPQPVRAESAARDILNQESETLIPQYVIRQIWHATQGEALMVSDVGQNQMWEAQ